MTHKFDSPVSQVKKLLLQKVYSLVVRLIISILILTLAIKMGGFCVLCVLTNNLKFYIY